MASDRAQGIAVVPSADHLERDAILQSMLSHLSEFEGKYEPVNIQELKNSVVKKVLDAADDSQPDVVFDERAQLQGFLKAFQDTHAFKAQFKILDKATQEQIQAFLKKPEDFQDTDPWKATKERGGFKLPVPNPDVSQILNTGATSADAPGGIGKFFLNAFTKIVRPIILCSLNLRMSKAAKELERNQSRKYIGGPKIVEDEKSHKEMAVCRHLFQA